MENLRSFDNAVRFPQVVQRNTTQRIHDDHTIQGLIMRQHYTPPRHHRLALRAQAVADYLTALAIGLGLTALALAYFDIL